jgi:hypothetical protein
MHFNVFKTLRIHNTYKHLFVGGKPIPKNRFGLHAASFESGSTGLIIFLILSLHCCYYEFGKFNFTGNKQQFKKGYGMQSSSIENFPQGWLFSCLSIFVDFCLNF